MTRREPPFEVKVDVTNPGQFFACCGLLELGHRLWGGVEGWFADSTFNVSSAECPPDGLASIVHKLGSSKLSALDELEEKDRKQLEARRRERSKRQRSTRGKDSKQSTLEAQEELSKADEERLKELGTRARKGSLLVADFSITLDWWQDEDEAVPKTWAGRQEIHKIARAAQVSFTCLRGVEQTMFDYRCVLVTPPEYLNEKKREPDPVEPFYFDARRYAHALDVGFSLDVQDAETVAHPAVELLCLIGLQRFRPSAGNRSWSFSYWTWPRPLAASIAAGVVSGTVPMPASRQYQFDLHFRDDQKRYKAFGFSSLSGE